MSKIKNIIFDLGGVFIDIDFSKTEKAFEELGLPEFKNFFSQHTASPLFEDLETGKLTPYDFYDAFRNETGLSVTNQQIERAWNALLGKFEKIKIQWLQEIGKRYKVYLFSNTNLIHYNRFQQIYSESFGFQNFDDLFIKAHYSHELGMRKPYEESFRYLLKIEGLEASETLFIDDTIGNVEGAKKVGMQAFLLVPPINLIELGL